MIVFVLLMISTSPSKEFKEAKSKVFHSHAMCLEVEKNIRKLVVQGALGTDHVYTHCVAKKVD